MRRGRIALVGVIVALVIAVDQVSKTWAEDRLRHGPVHVAGPLEFRLVFNSGFSFSLGAGHPLAVSILAGVVSGALLVYALVTSETGRSVASALVVGGALSNLADRVVRHHHGAVIDFIEVPHWPVFNVADACITIGVVLLVLQSVRAKR